MDLEDFSEENNGHIFMELAMSLAEIQTDIRAIEEELVCREEINFGQRADVLDFIDFHIIRRIEAVMQHNESSKELRELLRRAVNAKCVLEKIDADLFIKLRGQIRSGVLSGTIFSEVVQTYFETTYGDDRYFDQIGYDSLDTFINGILSDHPVPESILQRKPEMIFYQKTPARIIMRLAACISRDDIFFDLGSGLGQAAVLVNLISRAISKGIEYEPAYHRYATACASDLKLSNVEFTQGDVREADFKKGTVFFMYTQFEGNILDAMLEILRKESLKRTIRIFTYGPCSAQVAQQQWLTHEGSKTDDCYTLYEFTSS